MAFDVTLEMAERMLDDAREMIETLSQAAFSECADLTTRSIVGWSNAGSAEPGCLTPSNRTAET